MPCLKYDTMCLTFFQLKPQRGDALLLVSIFFCYNFILMLNLVRNITQVTDYSMATDKVFKNSQHHVFN